MVIKKNCENCKTREKTVWNHIYHVTNEEERGGYR